MPRTVSRTMLRVNVIFDSPNLDRDASQPANDAPEVFPESRFDRRGDDRRAMLRAEDQMVVETRVGLRHGAPLLSPLRGWGYGFTSSRGFARFARSTPGYHLPPLRG